MKKLTRACTWLAYKSVSVTLFYLAEFQGFIGAGRVLTFLLVMGTIGAFVISASDEQKIVHQSKGRPVPRWISSLFGLAFTCTLIWFGWWFTAITSLLGMAAIGSVYEDNEKQANANRDKAA